MESWSLVFTDWDPNEELLRETLTTLGNGFFATRGAAEESTAVNDHYPGTYISGGYNRLTTLIAGRNVENEDLINWPNWLCISFRYPDEEWFDLKKVKIKSYNQNLNLREGILTREILFEDQKGRESLLATSRFVSMDNQHVGAISYSLTPINWNSSIEIKSWIDGSVKNKGVKRYSKLENSHLEIKSKKQLSDNCFRLSSMSSQSQIHVSQAVRNEIIVSDPKDLLSRNYWEDADCNGITFLIDARKEAKITLIKTLTMFTSKDRACSHPDYDSEKLLTRLPSFDIIRDHHVRQWERVWGLCDIELKDKIRVTRLLRLHIFHLIQTVSPKSIDLDVGVPARGLHGEAYRGHIFWDEIFILPFLNLRMPELSRSLLLYRFRRLEEAKANAQINGFKGALYPWQSGSNGEEESQVLHLNPLSGRWIPDATMRQRHINAAILYNIWQYYQATDDKDFLSNFGIEMAIEICRFWISSMSFNSTKDRFEILNVVGPDEFHTRYPGSEEAGINNNSYTNFMASWCIKTAVALFLTLAEDRQIEIMNLLQITKADLNTWLDMSRKIYLPIDEDGIIHQFEHAEKLKDFDWESYKKQYGNLQRIDRILELEGKDVNDYKVSKQADVLMLYYLFPRRELYSGFQWLGYQLDQEKIEKNINYHLGHSSNGSTLSRIVHAWVLSKYDIEKAWTWFNMSLETDVADIQGGTTHEGIHLGAMSGTVDLVQRCFTGIEVDQDVLWINPKLPAEITNIKLLIHFRGHSIELRIEERNLVVTIKRSWTQKGKIGVHGDIFDIKQGDVRTFSLDHTHIVENQAPVKLTPVNQMINYLP